MVEAVVLVLWWIVWMLYGCTQLGAPVIKHMWRSRGSIRGWRDVYEVILLLSWL